MSETLLELMSVHVLATSWVIASVSLLVAISDSQKEMSLGYWLARPIGLGLVALLEIHWGNLLDTMLGK